MCSVLGDMAALIVHPDIKSAVRRAAFIPKHWAAYLNAFADIREHYDIVPACTFEEVMSIVDDALRQQRIHVPWPDAGCSPMETGGRGGDPHDL